MAKKTAADIDVKGKKVLMRVDFNVPIEGGKITDIPPDRAERCRRSKHPRSRWAAHPHVPPRPAQGRARAEVFAQADGPAPGTVAQQGCAVRQRLHWPRGREGGKRFARRPGPALENLRFHKEEEKNDPTFLPATCKARRRLHQRYLRYGTPRAHASTFGSRTSAMAGKPRPSRSSQEVGVPWRRNQQSQAPVRRHPRRRQSLR